MVASGRRGLAGLVLALALAMPARSGADALRMEALAEQAPPVALGGGRSLADLQGHWVLLHFWATWCEPCRAELPALDKLAARERDRIDVVAVSIDDADEHVVQTFGDGLGLSLPLIPASTAQASDRYWGWGVPVTYLIDPGGRLVGRMLGPRDWTSAAVTESLHTTIDRR